jgi:hypothetical protein
LAGSVLATTGAGLIYTLDIGSPSSHWIGYQVLAGIGIGLSIQVPIIANQAFVSMSELSSITAITLCKYFSQYDTDIKRITNTSLQSSKPSAVHSSSLPAKLHSPIAFSHESLLLLQASVHL